MSDVRLIVFDLGRVFIRICDDWLHACRRLGIEPPTIPTDAESKARFAEIAHRYDAGQLDLQTFAKAVAELGGFTAEQVIRLQQSYLLEPFPGVNALLDDLARAGYLTACLSNTSENHWQLVHDPTSPHALPMEHFTYKFASHLVGLAKPDDAIYAFVERETRIAPQQIVFFDDLETNIVAARKRGWHAHQIDITHDPIFQIREHLHEYCFVSGEQPLG